MEKPVTVAIIFREPAENHWVYMRWSQILGFLHRLAIMPLESMHLDILKISMLLPIRSVCVVKGAASCMKQYSRLMMKLCPFHFPIEALNLLDFEQAWSWGLLRLQHGPQVSPRTAFSKGVNLYGMICVPPKAPVHSMAHT